MSALNPDNQSGRHSGAGRNPAKKYIPRSGQNQGVVPLARGMGDQLDSGLMKLLAIRLSRQTTPTKSLVMRRNDVVLSNGSSILRRTQQGFSVVTAIFLLVVLAFLGTAMVMFSVNQQQTDTMDVMGARAYQAARAGVDWGAYQVLRNPAGISCPVGGAVNGVTMPAGSTLSGFTVNVSCWSYAPVSEGANTVTMYRLLSTATQGTVGSPGYVERQMTVTIAQ